ncbi:MAG: hypothetical protein ACI8ZN_000483 [Bacteroidia bacterium]|jgi:hypothetical protein
MKNKFAIILIISTFFVGFVGCNQSSKEGSTTPFGIFGDSTISAEHAIPCDSLPSLLEARDSVQTKLTGTISQVCQTKGCWMGLAMSDGKMIRVRFKDYGFFVPKNSSERTAVVEGTAFMQTISVEQQRHHAVEREAGKEEMEAITEPLVEYSFVATGVLID